MHTVVVLLQQCLVAVSEGERDEAVPRFQSLAISLTTVKIIINSTNNKN